MRRMTTQNVTRARPPLVAIGLLCVLLAACGGAVNHDRTIAELRAAMSAPVATPGDRQTHNDLVVRVAEEGALEGLLRDEVTPSMPLLPRAGMAA